MSSSASGRIGGMSFRCGRSGQSAGDVPYGSWKETGPRNSAKQALIEAGKAWKALTSDQLAEWVLFYGSNAIAHEEFIKTFLNRWPYYHGTYWPPAPVPDLIASIACENLWFPLDGFLYADQAWTDQSSDSLLKFDRASFGYRRLRCNERKYRFYNAQDEFIGGNQIDFGYAPASAFIRVRRILVVCGQEVERFYFHWDRVDDGEEPESPLLAEVDSIKSRIEENEAKMRIALEDPFPEAVEEI